MHVRRYEQQTIFDLIMKNIISDFKDLRMPPVLERMDAILDDGELVAIVHAALGRRATKSRTLGRPSTPSEVVLRLLVLKHLFDWTYAMLEQEVRGSLVYRQFARIGCERVPDEKSMIRLANAIGEETLRQIHERIVSIAREERVVRGTKMRVDTTVVETNVKYPTDSRLLGDAVRVMTRKAHRLAAALKRKPIRGRQRSVNRRLFEIALSARGGGAQKEQRRKQLYRGLLEITQRVIHDSEQVLKAASRALRGAAKEASHKLIGGLRQIVKVARGIVKQTRTRIMGGDVHYGDKILSIFEPHTEAIRKGKASKPTEFGKMVKIQEAENQIITDYVVEKTRRPDTELLLPSIEAHKRHFGRAPRLVAADAGFYSASNVEAATAAGVKFVAIPKRGKCSAATRAKQRGRQFRRAQAWRTGCEGKISILKRARGMRRCRNRGMAGMQRSVALGAISENLWQIAKQTMNR